MAWVKVESSVSRHRKFLEAGPAASWLWLCGMCYCQEGTTDGFIPFQALNHLGVKSPSKYAATLVKVGLWETCDGGWRVHDYLDHNNSSLYIKGIREERRVAGKTGGIASGQSRRSTDAKQVASTDAKQIASDSTKQSAEASREPSDLRTAISDQRTANSGLRFESVRRAPLHDRSHREHVFCGRICVHSRLHGEFVRRRNHPGADQELQAWYLAVNRLWSEGGPHAADEPGDEFAFWRGQYAEKWPAASVKAQGTSKTAGNVAALQRFINRGQA